MREFLILCILFKYSACIFITNNFQCDKTQNISFVFLSIEINYTYDCNEILLLMDLNTRNPYIY